MVAGKEKILIIDNEETICKILETRLKIRGYDVYTARDGKTALQLFRCQKPNLIVLDIMLPKLNGYEVCGELRKESNVPIIMLTALGNISDRIMGLEFGADDYIIKPFSPKELEARIRAVLRRTTVTVKNGKLNSKKQVQIKNLLIDLHKRQIFLKGRQVHLTGLEFNLLELLLDNAGHLLSRTYILSIIWGYIPERYVDTRVVDVHISKLRSKLEDDPSNPALILTVRGNGYMFQTF